MDEERTIDCEKMDEVMLPGFRFHPTDEELVGFYLKRKIQQRPLSIELIKQLDIYKYDPWDLPKLASTGEKEWYFYCPRDRKYRNSARPNRVTGAGFWKATGTDRPIYSSEGTTKCIGLKKSLVFYRGRAAKGVKTEWMMHEFRLPSLVDPASPSRFTHKMIPAHDSWAICRIFKKTNPAVHQRANNFTHYDRRLSLSPVSPETTTSSESPNTPAAPVTPQAVVPSQQSNAPLGFIPMNIVQPGSPPPVEACPSLDFTSSYETLSSLLMLGPINYRPEDFSLPSLLTSETTDKSPAVDLSSILLNTAWSDHGGGFGSIHEGLDSYCGYQDCHRFDGDGLFGIPDDRVIGSLMKGPDDEGQQWDRLVDLPYGPADVNGAGAWRSNLVGWDTSELSTLFSTSTPTTTTTKCHT